VFPASRPWRFVTTFLLKRMYQITIFTPLCPSLFFGLLLGRMLLGARYQLALFSLLQFLYNLWNWRLGASFGVSYCDTSGIFL
jgi:hypothetical protein